MELSPTAIVIKMSSRSGLITFVIDNDRVYQLDPLGTHQEDFDDHHDAMQWVVDNTAHIIRDMDGRFVL